MYDLIAIMIPIVLAVCIVVAIKIVQDSRLRRRFADVGADREMVEAILTADRDGRRRDSLRWAIVMLSLSVGFFGMWGLSLDADDPLSYAVLFGVTGVGLLAYRAFDRPSV